MADEQNLDQNLESNTQEGEITPEAASTEDNSLVSSQEPMLPEGVSERTRKEFEKLKAQNLEYQRRLYSQPPTRPVMSRQEVDNSEGSDDLLYDPQTGLVDVQKLNEMQKRLTQAEQRAQAAQETVYQQSEQAQTKEAYTSYPELDPNREGFDEKLHNLTRSILQDSLVYPESYGDKQLSFKEAADQARNILGSNDKQNRMSEDQIIKNEQAVSGVEGRSSQGVQRQLSQQNQEELSYRTRRGDKEAMTLRMSRIPTT